MKKIPRMKDFGRKKNTNEIYPFHVISHDMSQQEENLLSKIKRNQENRKKLFEIHQKIQSLSPSNQLLTIPISNIQNERP
jgi:predicted transcriptional regulator